jgi:glyoxylate/hydroxypyruvate reductase A
MYSMQLLFLSTTSKPAVWVGAAQRGVARRHHARLPRCGRSERDRVRDRGGAAAGRADWVPESAAHQSLWVGVESLLTDTTLPPDVPLARLVDPGMTETMTETVLQHVLNAHRFYEEYREQQARAALATGAAGAGERPPRRSAGPRELGSAAARALAGRLRRGGWSRQPKDLAGIGSFTGPEGFLPFLARTEILVCLLPLTAATRGILDARAFAALPRGATIINLARGGHIDDDDLLAALDAGQSVARSSMSSISSRCRPTIPYWRTRASWSCRICRRDRPADRRCPGRREPARLKAGEPLLNVVDRAAGY